MLMPTKNRKAIYEYLFKEGVCVAKKDYNLKTHPDIPNVTNLEVIKACKSLASREYVKEQFAWRHHYWYLTNEGIDYLREYLHLPAEIVPSTVKAKQREPRPGFERMPRGPKVESDRDAYRTAEKVTEAGPGAAPVSGYRGGYGRVVMDGLGPSSSSREKHHLETSDASSLFLLKGELYRKISEQRGRATTGAVKIPKRRYTALSVVAVSGSSNSILLINKEEEKKIAEEKRQREARIRELEKSIAQDEEQRKRVQKILEEKVKFMLV
ncbi:40S ribosomal protein S10 [Dirofilaria immitis]|nr:40S ribosomal protein S10 [Dirofilaria immitis]